MTAFASEATTTLHRICDEHPELYAEKLRLKKGGSPRGSAVSSLVFAIENRCVNALMQNLQTQGFTTQTLSFDGLQYFPNGDKVASYENAEAFICSETGYMLKIVEKHIAFHDRATLLEPVVESYLEEGLLIKAAAESDFISLKAGMGMGKTRQLMLLLQHAYANKKSKLLVCGRINSVRDMIARCKQYNMYFESYLDLPKGVIQSHDHPYTIVCWESSMRLKGAYDYVIYDEQRSLCESAVARTNRLSTAANLKVHVDLTALAEKVIFMDADMLMDGAAYAVQDMLMANRCSFRCAQLLLMADELEKQGQDNSDLVLAAVDVLTGRLEKIKRIENNVIKMEREVVLVNDGEFLHQLHADLTAGHRIVVAVGSVSEAANLAEMFKEVAVGLYTSRTDNHSDFEDITKAWDQHQLIIFTSTLTTGADYCTPIHRVYAFPCINTCTPHDMHQMIGRVRNVDCPSIWVRSHTVTGEVPLLRTVDRVEVDRQFVQQLELLKMSGAHHSKKHMECTQLLKFTIGPKFYERKYTPATSNLLVLQAYSNARRVYTRSMPEWLSYFAYMGRQKGYKICLGSRHNAVEFEAQAASYIALKNERKVVDTSIFADLDVSEMLNDDALHKLQQCATGQLFKGSSDSIEP